MKQHFQKISGWKKALLLLLLCTALFACGCSSGSKMKDGFYTAEMSGYSYGWKEYLCIMVKNGTVIYAEFNAKNPSGYIKSWDNTYMETMLTVNGTYPNEYTRNYVSQLLETQDPEAIDAISGASSSADNFKKLAEAAVRQAVKGDPSTIVVE